MTAFIERARERAISLLARIDWAGPLLVRLTVGLVFVATGWGKLHSLDGVTAFFRELGIPAPAIQALVVSAIEFAGGLCLLAGLATRIAAALLAGVMAVAIATAKLPAIHGVVELAGTIELAYLAMFAWLVIAGAGRASLDHALIRLLGRPQPIASV